MKSFTLCKIRLHRFKLLGLTMSFFKKLKSKLFRSSSRIEEGIDAIVENEDSEAENNLPDDDDFI